MNIIEKTYSFKGKLVARKSTNRAILHHAEAPECTPDQIHNWHLKNGWAGIGYHFVVRKDGTIYRGRPEHTIGSHAGGSNSDSIGICAEGTYTKETMPEMQKQALKWLVAYIKAKYGFSKVQKHSDVKATSCPGRNFPFEEIAGVGASTGVATSAPHAPQSVAAPAQTGNPWIISLQTECNRQGFSNQKVDGIPGSVTLAGCPTLKQGSSGNITKLLQQILGIAADGIFGKNTKAAVMAYQRSKGLVEDGVVGKNTWSKLLGL